MQQPAPNVSATLREANAQRRVDPCAWARGAIAGERRRGMTVTEKAVVASDDDEQEEAARVAYARAVGSRLRAMRKQMRLSLQAVEAMSDQEFKASVLGAYERGERAISVPRLQRLAKLYDVPVDQLLPNDDATVTRWGAAGTAEDVVPPSARRAMQAG